MTKRVGLLVALMACGISCAANPGGTGSSTAAEVGSPTVTTDAASYAPGQSVTVTWANLAGNVHDWVAIAPAGSSADTVVQWMYTAGAVNGSATFIAPGALGSYSARAFLNDSYTQLAESAAFTVATPTSATVTTDAASYPAGGAILVTWAGLPGNASDWIALAPQGSSPQTVLQWVYAGGAAAGSYTFAGIGVTGSYVARAFSNSYDLLGESAAFMVAVPTSTGVITTDFTRYPWGGHAIATWSGFPGGATDWVAIAPQGAAPQVTGSWFYMHGASGTAGFDLPGEDLPTTPAAFVIRAFASDSYSIIGESAPFSLAGTITTDASTYLANFAIGVTTSGLPTNPTKLAIAIPSSPGSSFVATSLGGNPAFPQGISTEGTYVARVLDATSNKIYAESAPFTVAGHQIVLNPPCTTSCPPAGSPSKLSVTFLNLAGGATDWISIAPLGSSDTTVTTWVYNAQVNGSVDLNTPVAPGTYVVRAYINDSYTKIAESASFVLGTTTASVVITQKPSSISNNATPTFAFSSTNPTATFECQVDGVVTFTACTSPWTSPQLSQADYTFRVRATDPAGNATTATYTWTVDLTPPSITINQAPSTTTNPTATFAFSSNEGQITFECEIDGVVAFTPCTSPWSQVVPGGTQLFQLRGTDPAGNQTVVIWPWTVNLPGPTVAITGGPPALSNSTTAQFTFTTTGSVASTQCSIDNGAYTGCASPVTYNALSEAVHVFVVRVSDAANNTHSASRSFTIDLTPPVLAKTLSPPAVTRDRHPVVGFTSDTHYDNGHYGLYVDGTFDGRLIPPGVTAAPPTNLGQPVNPLADGPHTITVRIWDAAFNMSELNWSFVVDTTGPTVSLDSTPTDPGTTAVATFTFSSPDAVGFECQIDNAPYTSCSSPFSAMLPDGVHLFRVRGLDAYGNATIKAFSWQNLGQPSVTTPVGAFDNGHDITVTWNGLPGNVFDWVAIAPAGSSDTTYTQRVYTGGSKSGSAVFTGGATTDGNYVARAYANNTFTKLAESTTFSVSTPCTSLGWGPATAIHTPGDVASLAPYTDLGDLTISPYADFAINLPCLQSLHSLTINDGDGTHPVQALRAPRLASVASGISITNGPPIFDVPAMTTLGGVLRINQPTLPDLSPLRRLHTIQGLSIDSNSSVGPLEFGGITTLPVNATLRMTGGQFNGLNNLTTLTGTGAFAPQISSIGGFNRLRSVPGAFTISGTLGSGFMSLETIGGDAVLTLSGGTNVTLPSLNTVVGHLWFKTSGTLQAISLPLLTKAYRLTVEGTASSLQSFDAPLLSSVTYQVEFKNLLMLPICMYYNLIDQLAAPLPTYETAGILGNTYGVCTYNF